MQQNSGGSYCQSTHSDIQPRSPRLSTLALEVILEGGQAVEQFHLIKAAAKARSARALALSLSAC